MSWQPSAIVREDWGRLRLIMNNQDVSFYRNVPAQVRDWSSNEPFDDATMTLGFPQITPYEALPTFLADYCNVDLRLVRPNGTQVVLFEGMFTVENDRMTQKENGLEITVIGALYQLDFFRRVPELFRRGDLWDDLWPLISDEFDHNLRPSLRTGGIITPGWVGVSYDQIGAWQPSLTGYLQELLSIATSSGLPLPGEAIKGIAVKPDGTGYWLLGTMGSVLAFGGAKFYGSMVGTKLNEPGTGIAPEPGGEGYWFVAEDGGVFTFGYTIGYQGGLGGTPMDLEIVSIDTMPTGQGYAMVRSDGSVYNFGNSAHYGNPTLVANDKAVDIQITPSGVGYNIATKFGYVYAFGDAAYHGGLNNAAVKVVGVAVRPQGDGYWLLRDNGEVYGYGVGASGTIANFTAPVDLAAADIAVTPTGKGLYIVDEAGNIYTYGDAVYKGGVNDGGGKESQWTIMKEPGRYPKLKVKDLETVHWTVTLGTPGLEHDLTRDLSMAPNAYYGEGVDDDGCIWRNSKYPGFQPETVPVFGGTTQGIGSSHADVRKFEQQMFDSGWTDFEVDGTFSRRDSNLTRVFQHQAGLSETGTINAQTWAAAFAVGSYAGELKSAYIAPLAMRSEVNPHLFNAKGDVSGSNPGFNLTIPRIETYDSYGSRVTKHEGTVSAEGRMRRDYPATYSGTLRLNIDPQEGSRFEIKAGHNIKLKSHRGVDRLFHIARSHVQWESGQVSLDIDTGGKDFLTLAAFRQHLRETSDPAGRQQRSYRNSRNTEDRKVVWDCESGAGIIPRHAINAGLWNVLRVPCGESGNVVSTEFIVETPARFSIGIFDKPVTHSMLANVGSSPLNSGYWDDDTGTEFWNKWGLIMAYGGQGQAGGFYPGLESDGSPLTGRMVDDASWHFQAISPPWLWIALWCESPSTNYISGRLRPGIMT